jgi:hypothetical protein
VGGIKGVVTTDFHLQVFLFIKQQSLLTADFATRSKFSKILGIVFQHWHQGVKTMYRKPCKALLNFLNHGQDLLFSYNGTRRPK